MLQRFNLKSFNKMLYIIIAALVLYIIGVFVYMALNNPAKYQSANPDEAYPQLYAGLTKKLLSNPSTEFINELKLAYADRVITEDEFTHLALKHNLDISVDLFLIFDETKQEFHKTWLQHKS